MVVGAGVVSALWFRLRALDGLLCCDFCDRLFQHTISFVAVKAPAAPFSLRSM
jgi:hypothetical protein